MEKGAVIKYNSKKAPRTGNWRYDCPKVDEKKCVGCETCVPFCPEACIEIKKSQSGKKIASIDYDFCKGCGVCASVCPFKAIEISVKK